MTSDERREVAARLRAYPLESVKADHKGEDPLQLPADVMYDLMDIAGVGEDFDSLLPSLADLIDLTCRAVHQGTSMDDELVCSECGASLGVEVDDEQRFIPNFCSCCGSRVVSGDE